MYTIHGMICKEKTKKISNIQYIHVDTIRITCMYSITLVHGVSLQKNYGHVTRGMRPARSRSVAAVPPRPDVAAALAGPLEPWPRKGRSSPRVWKPWRNHGETMGKPWGNHGETVKAAEHSRFFRENQGF